MSIVLFLALPISALVVIDYLKLKSELQYEIRQLKKLKKEIKETHEKTDSVKSSDAGGV
jgi:cell shape-determining protein MreC